MTLQPKQKIKINIDFSESMQYIEESFDITLNNGWDAIFTFFAEIIISENKGANFYEENQLDVKIEYLEINDLEVFDGEEPIILDETAQKQLKQNIKNSIIWN